MIIRGSHGAAPGQGVMATARSVFAPGFNETNPDSCRVGAGTWGSGRCHQFVAAHGHAGTQSDQIQ